MGHEHFDPLRKLDDMAGLIAHVTGEPVERVVARLESERVRPGHSVADDFAKSGGPRYVWGPHMEAFYGETDAFIYELAVWNRNRMKAGLRRWTERHLARQNRPLDLLGIGDGLGFDCLHLARKQHRVTYFELPGKGERFARALFERSGAAVAVLTDPEAIGREAYDAITCFDVLEHVPDPPAMVWTLASHLRPGGLLYISAPFFMIHGGYPTHLKSNRKYSGRLAMYRAAGLRLVGGTMSWCPVILQKPGAEGASRSTLGCLGVTAMGPVFAIGRFAAWPFAPLHWVRRRGNRVFH